MNIYSIYFILIQLCHIFQKFKNCLFEFQMPFSQNDAVAEFIISLSLWSHFFGVEHTTELCDIPFSR